MKKAISMCLCFVVLLSVCGILAAPASAEATPSVIETFYEGEDGAFFYPFDKEMSLGSRLAMMGITRFPIIKGIRIIPPECCGFKTITALTEV